MNRHWHFIINPISGKGGGLKLWSKVEQLLLLNAIPYSFDISEYHKHTIELVTKRHAEGYRNYLGIGGDGTINEIVNGIFNSPNNKASDRSTISLYPVGTGNDWVRNHEEKLSEINIISKLKAHNTYFHDIGVVKLNKPFLEYFFINIAGAGIDGKVVQDLETLDGKKSKWMYIKSLLKSLLQFSAPVSQVSVDGISIFSGKSLLIAAAQGQYFGSGMHLSPKALPNNGIFDITLVKKDSHLKVFSQLYKLFTGKIATATFVDKFQGENIVAEFSIHNPVQADGEFVGESKKVEFEVLKKAVLVLR